MAEAPVTYGRLDEALRSLGFTVRTLEGKARIYKHESTPATIILPDSRLDAVVLPHHLIVVRSVLKDHDIADPTDLALKPQRAS